MRVVNEPAASQADELEATSRVALEWHDVLERIAKNCASKPGRLALAAREPESTLAGARSRMERTRDALELRGNGAPIPAGAVPAIDEVLARLAKGVLANGAELRDVASVLSRARLLRDYAREHAATYPELCRTLDSEPKLDRILSRLEASIEPTGTVSDAASSALAEARRRARDALATLRQRLNQLIGRYADVLSGAYFTEHEGRYTLPVRSDAHYRVDGAVLGSSNSGGTLFIEPREVADLANQARRWEAKVDEETARVLAELSSVVRGEHVAVLAAERSCIEADVLGALVAWAVETSSVPIVVTDEVEIDLRDARHPLLVLGPEPVVPNDVRLREREALVISGPNAGGKTVALKCLGLCAWMVRAGVPLPVAPGSRLGFFDRVFADIGDRQSLFHSLSTFSAHVESLTNVLVNAGPRTLVLLDEVASGTDPEEGAALAGAVLEALVARGATVAATTHYERLKELAAEDGPLVNASVGFDFDTMSPSYRLTLGVPGPSSALFVAARHGLPDDVVGRARKLLSVQSVEREQAVMKLSLARERLELEREALTEERRRQAELEAELEGARAASKAEALARAKRETEILVSEVRAARAELEGARRRLRDKKLEKQELRDTERQVNRVAAKVALGGALSAVAHGAPEPSPSRANTAAAVELAPGDRVVVRATGASATVLDVDQRGVQLRVGAVRLTVPRNEIGLAKGRPPAKERAAPRLAPAVRSAPVPAVRTRNNTLDLRGARVEDAAPRVEAFADQLLREGEAVGFVLHGHGTGALKTTVRQLLRTARYVERAAEADADQGGDAFTMFWLR